MKPKTFWQQVLDEYNHKQRVNPVFFICNASQIFRLEWEDSEEFRNYCFDMAEYYFPDEESGRAHAKKEGTLMCQVVLFDRINRDIRLDFLEKMVKISD